MALYNIISLAEFIPQDRRDQYSTIELRTYSTPLFSSQVLEENITTTLRVRA